MLSTSLLLKKNYWVLLNQLDGNLASDISTRCSGRPRGNENYCRDSLIYRLYVRVWLLTAYKLTSLETSFHSPEDDQSIWSKHWKLSSHQVDSREHNNLSSFYRAQLRNVLTSLLLLLHPQVNLLLMKLIPPETLVVQLKFGWMITRSTITQQDLLLKENHMESKQ